MIPRTRLLRWNLQSLAVLITGLLNGIHTDHSGDSYRLQRCISYRNLTFDGSRPDWVPYEDSTDPCSLRCRDAALGARLLVEARVPDGTKCRNRTADDSCVNGTCVSAGCDGSPGSGFVRDRCGVCGGDGSSCDSEEEKEEERGRQDSSSFHFRWYHNNYSACSVSCGIGLQTAGIACRDEMTQTTVGDDRCDVTLKPEVQTKTCRAKCRQHVWATSEWSECSRSCGEGVKRRTAFCAEELPEGSFERKWDASCAGRRPELTAVCQEDDCPQWIAGQWSPCSTTCSVGVQMRAVVCKGVDCPEGERPVSERICQSGITCKQSDSRDREQDKERGELQGRGDYEFDLELNNSPESQGHGAEVKGHRTVRHSRLKRRKGISPTQNNDDQSGDTEPERKKVVELEQGPPIRLDQDAGGGSGDIERPVEGAAKLESSPGGGDNREISTTPSFVVSSWGLCSAVCGNGVRTRRVQCRVYEESSQSVVELSDSNCAGTRPLDAEYCHQGDCYDEAVSENYAWSLSGYGLCSRSCAGGTQEATFSCLRISNFTMTKNDRCQHLPLPRKPPRPCNEHRCPARWRAFPNGLCSASCGGGQQERSVRCIDDHDNGDVREVADDHCPPPKPPKLTLCNMAPCPPSWNVDSWSECSVTCGQGVQFRQVRCEQKVSLSTVATVNESLCASLSPAPQGNQTCLRADCPVKARKSVVQEELKSFLQLNRTNKVPLLVGGTAILILGTTVQVTCTVRNFNRSLITWHRVGGGRGGVGDRDIGRNGRVKVSPKGLLRIRESRASDAGVYVCRAGADSGRINITFVTLLKILEMEKGKDRVPFVRPPLPLKGGDNKNRVHDEEEQRYEISVRNIIRKFSLDDLPFQFYPHPWSVCSKTCGGSGLQSRDITCELTMDGYALAVNDSYCLKKGLQKPIETRDCGYESSALTCPSWDVDPWQECTDESCSRTGIGSRRRLVHCLAHNRSRLASTYCSTESRPKDSEDCEHDNCTAVWRTSEWTKCSVSCGGRGTKTRAIDCVWETNGNSASVECEDLPRPEATKQCFMPSCSEHHVCRDESKYCVHIPKLHMCRFPQYKHECCYSCSLHSASSSSSFVTNHHQQVAPPTQQGLQGHRSRRAVV